MLPLLLLAGWRTSSEMNDKEKVKYECMFCGYSNVSFGEHKWQKDSIARHLAVAHPMQVVAILFEIDHSSLTFKAREEYRRIKSAY